MIYSENLSNKELMLNAMPIVSLSRKQWNILLRHLEVVEEKKGESSDLYKTLKQLHNNQARLEIMNNYFFGCHEDFNEPVAEKRSCLITTF